MDAVTSDEDESSDESEAEHPKRWKGQTRRLQLTAGRDVTYVRLNDWRIGLISCETVVIHFTKFDILWKRKIEDLEQKQ